MLIEKQVEIKLVNNNTVFPEYQTEGAAAFDLIANITGPVVIIPNEVVKIGTGVAIHINDPSLVGMVYPRSGLSTKHGIVLANGTGVIDSDYQGEIIVALVNTGQQPFTIEPQMRIAQYMLTPVYRAKFEKVENFSSSSDRGEKGFGSTGA
jgi:dUTP pyrophosphatase